MRLLVIDGGREVRRSTSIGCDVLTLLGDRAVKPHVPGTSTLAPNARELDRLLMAEIAKHGASPVRLQHRRSCKCKVCLWLTSRMLADPVNVHQTLRTVRGIVRYAQTMPVDSSYAGEILKACHALRRHYVNAAQQPDVVDVMRTQCVVLASAYGTAARLVWDRMLAAAA